jgi:hypothetical protein
MRSVSLAPVLGFYSDPWELIGSMGIAVCAMVTSPISLPLTYQVINFPGTPRQRFPTGVKTPRAVVAHVRTRRREAAFLHADFVNCLPCSGALARQQPTRHRLRWVTPF